MQRQKSKQSSGYNNPFHLFTVAELICLGGAGKGIDSGTKLYTTTADPVIAVACSHAGHVLVTHDKDFKQITKRLNITQRQYRTNLHRIHLRCDEPNGARRLRDSMSLIEAEWQLVIPGRPMVIDLNESSIHIHR